MGSKWLASPHGPGGLKSPSERANLIESAIPVDTEAVQNLALMHAERIRNRLLLPVLAAGSPATPRS
jgi:hypothetical protein